MEKTVKINCKGLDVSGEIIFRTAADIVVMITEPYYGLKSGMHIPWWSRPISNFTSEHGYETAQWLLKNLYILGLAIETNAATLKKEYLDYVIAKNQLLPLKEKHKERKMYLRKEFKKSAFNQAYYQTERKKISVGIFEIDCEINKLFEKHFMRFFENHTCVSTIENVVDYISKL